LQELIYKGGNDFVKKAYVSITFKSLNKNNHEETKITRQVFFNNINFFLIIFKLISNSQILSESKSNEYFINEKKSTALDIYNFLNSIQLNVNTPNFLIMQGQVTKVVNMKPIEVLSMIEEAASTKAFDKQKKITSNVIVEENLKLNSNDSVLNDIRSIINNLKAQHNESILKQEIDRKIQDYKKTQLDYELEINDRKIICYLIKSNKLNLRLAHCEKLILNIEQNIPELSNEIIQLKKELKEKKKSLIDLNKKTEKQDLQIFKFEYKKTNLDLEIQFQENIFRQTAELNNVNIINFLKILS
jgi:structural maintenance of chromosome 2